MAPDGFRGIAPWRPEPPRLTDVPLDLLGLKCPLPALRTRAALRRLRPGDRLIVEADDPLAILDVPHAAREAGGVVLSCTRTDGIVRVVIRREGEP